MRVRVLRITPDDARVTAQLAPGERVHHEVEILVGGETLTFDVALRANVLQGVDGSVLSAGKALGDLLRFAPDVLSRVLSLVGKVRRGQDVPLPVDIEGVGAGHDQAAP